MITGETEEGKFIIATPTKCGTTTIETVAKRHARQEPGDADIFRIMDWDKPRRQHRMALPPMVMDDAAGDIDIMHEGERIQYGVEGDWADWGDAARYLLVRNPFTRYISMYTYLSAPANYSQWGARTIQGRAWGGHDSSRRIDSDPMGFEEFLIWLAQQRELNYDPNKRGSLTTGFAYRSPWVWTDSLTMSQDFLASQPAADGEESGVIMDYIRLENVWLDLASLLRMYGIEEDVTLGGIHSNRSTGRGDGGAVPGSEEFWGGISCTRKVFKKRKFRPLGAMTVDGCGCGACRIGVVREAEALGYLG